MKRRLLLTTALTGVAFGARAAMKDDVNNPSVVSPLTNLTTSFPGLSVNGATNTITLSSVPSSAAVSAGVPISFTYTGAAPGGLTARWNPGSLTGAVSGFTASGGSGSASVTSPSSAATYTLSVTGTGANTASATAPNATVVSSGGGYNNLANWPSIGSGLSAGTTANRPVRVGSVLSWIGPVGGGPSTASDTPQSLTLTSSGPVTTSANGQTIQGLSITTSGQACITVAHNNCTVRRCYLQFAQWNGVAVVVSPGTTGTVIEDNVTNGSSDGSGDYAITGSTGGGSVGPVNATVRRNNMFGSIKCIGQTINNMTIIDNYFHGSSGNDNDYIDAWCVQSGSSNSSITHNYFDGSDSDGNDDSCISCLNYGTAGTVTGINFSGNACALTLPPNMAHQVIFDQHYTAHGGSGGQSGGLANITVANNGFYGNANPGSLDQTIVFTANSGNYVMATPQATSGALINGTGALTTSP